MLWKTGSKRAGGPVSASVAVLAVALSAMVVAWHGPIDDFWLTLASGRALRHGGLALGRALPFTFADMEPGALNPQWGAQWLASWLGLGPALLLNAAALGGGLLLTVARIRRRSSPTATAVTMLAVIFVVAAFLQPRPESWTVLGFPLALTALERWRGRLWLPAAYGLGVAVWGNLHGGFVLAELLAACFLAGDVLERRRHARRGVVSLTPRRTVWIGAATLALSFLGALANPNGVKILGYAFGLGANPVIRSMVTEWAHTKPLSAGGAPFWALVGLVVALRVRSRRPVAMAEVLLLAVTGVLAAWAVRSVPWFALAAAPVLAEDVDRVLDRSSGRYFRPLGDGFVRGCRIAVPVLFAGLLVFQLARPSLPGGLAQLAEDKPAAAVARLAKLSSGDVGRLFVEQAWGGFAAERLGADEGRVRTFVDGRIEVQTLATWRTYWRIVDGESPDAAGELRAMGVRWVLVRTTHHRLLASLAAAGWRLTAVEDATIAQAP